MKYAYIMAALLVVVAGCRTIRNLPPLPFVARTLTGPAHNEAMCTLRVITIPRSQLFQFERMWKYVDVGGLQGARREVTAMNGLKLARVDMRFRREFRDVLERMRKTQDDPEYFRLYEGLEQTFGIGPVFDEDSLFVWSDSSHVVGRHFRNVRYRMKLQVEVIRKGLADFHVSWQARTGPGLRKTVNIAPLTARVTLESRQSLIVTPADFSGRGLSKAFISGIGDAADHITFLIVTPDVIRKKAETPRDEED